MLTARQDQSRLSYVVARYGWTFLRVGCHLGPVLWLAASDLDRGSRRQSTSDAGDSIGYGVERALDRDVQRHRAVVNDDGLIGRDQLDAVGVGERRSDANGEGGRSLESHAISGHVSSVAGWSTTVDIDVRRCDGN